MDPMESAPIHALAPTLITADMEKLSPHDKGGIQLLELPTSSVSPSITREDDGEDAPAEDEGRKEHGAQRALKAPAAYEDTFPDGGQGWVVVCGCALFCAATVGWGCVWGVTEEFFKSTMFPGTPDSVLTTLGSLPPLIMTLGSIVAGKLADRYGYKPFLAAGAVIWVASMVASAFCTEVWQFFITMVGLRLRLFSSYGMGVMQGIADALIFPLIVALPTQWFLRHRALAIGIVVSGSSVGGAVASIVYRLLISSLGLRKALAIFTGIHTAMFAAGYFMMTERRPAHKRPAIVWFDRAFFSDPVFWSLALCFFFTVFGYFGPIFLLPTFTAQVAPHLPELLTALPLTVLNISAALGRILVGFAADRLGPVNALFVAITASGLTQLLVWMFISSYGGTMAFAVLYGFFCGCFLSLISAVAAKVYGVAQLAGLSGLLLLFNAPGNAAGAPIGGALLGATGNNWQVVAAYSGAVQVLGALCLLYARFKREPRLIAAY
ncbi:MFS general substrate transporter [Epithele typhae]|uniref:MFS general substrate transporter n=1 Tax=Epithele typhae TaxID=378194 RepID=UPI002007C6CA|nr:MFS general substrate transporter [Epithele typhae]KAH9931623.1 MFS general substrate transporter [Epithele typhae]